MLRKMFEVLNENQWKSELVIKFNRIVSQTILCKEKNEKALGFAIFVVEIFSEELAKVTLIHKLFATLLLKHSAFGNRHYTERNYDVKRSAFFFSRKGDETS